MDVLCHSHAAADVSCRDRVTCILARSSLIRNAKLITVISCSGPGLGAPWALQPMGLALVGLSGNTPMLTAVVSPHCSQDSPVNQILLNLFELTVLCLVFKQSNTDKIHHFCCDTKFFWKHQPNIVNDSKCFEARGWGTICWLTIKRRSNHYYVTYLLWMTHSVQTLNICA